jgi:hypothetical protein
MYFNNSLYIRREGKVYEVTMSFFLFLEFFTAVIYTYIYIHYCVTCVIVLKYLFRLVKGTIL